MTRFTVQGRTAPYGEPEGAQLDAALGGLLSTLDDLLRARGLYVACPVCEETFTARKAKLFDAKKPLPAYAREHLTGELAALTAERRALRSQRQELNRRSFAGAVSSGIGQTLEMLTPSLPGLPAIAQDCRVLLKPLDYVAFDGASSGEVRAIAFIEVKTGEQRLSKLQRAIKTVVERGAITLRIADHSLPIK